MFFIWPAPESNQADVEKVLAFSMNEYVCLNSRASLLYTQKKKSGLNSQGLYKSEELLLASFFQKSLNHIPEWGMCIHYFSVQKRFNCQTLPKTTPCVTGGGSDLS